jgi:hypothetical protein
MPLRAAYSYEPAIRLLSALNMQYISAAFPKLLYYIGREQKDWSIIADSNCIHNIMIRARQ